MLLVVLVISVISCKEHNITHTMVKVRGIVLDIKTGEPIPNARVTLLCWKEVNYDEETYDKIDTIANDKGIFEVYFSEGFKIDLGGVANNYFPAVRSIKDLSNATNLELKLSRNLGVKSMKELGQLAVFRREYTTKTAMNKEYHGIDILNSKNTQSLDSLDITIERNDYPKYSKVLIANKKGGIIPILENSDNDNSTIPIEGYVNKYKITGNEKGFFIKCRDGKSYSRIMIFSLEYDRTSPFKDGHFKDFGIMFNIILQTEKKESNNTDNIRLDHYILENI